MRKYEEIIELGDELSQRFLPEAVEKIKPLPAHSIDDEVIALDVEDDEPVIHAVSVRFSGKLPEIDVFVRNERGLSRSLLPKSNNVIIKVIEAPIAQTQDCSSDRTSRQRPWILGISAGHKNVTSGTIGCLCRIKGNTDNDVYVLSNNHVFGDTNDAVTGDEIWQPGRIYNGDSNATIAHFFKCYPLIFDGNNEVDAAVGKVDPSIPYKNHICKIGTITGIQAPEEDMEVRKHGAKTGLTRGIIESVRANAVVKMKGGNASFRNQIRVRQSGRLPISQGGDSGSVFVTGGSKNIRAVGLLFAGSTDGSYALANPLSRVCEQLDIEVITKGKK
jgi:hypothetical protein